MKIFIFWATILTTQLNSAVAQPRAADNTQAPLVFVDTFKTDMNHLVIGPNQIESIHVFKDSVAMAKYGDAGKFGVVLIHPRDDVKLLRVDKIIDKYKVSKDDNNLRICINKTLVQDPKLILIDDSEIEAVEVTTDRHWTNVEDANSGEKFINITTKTKRKSDL